MKSILIPIEDCASLQAQLEIGLAIAGQFCCHIDGVAPLEVPNTYAVGEAGAGVVGVGLESFEREQKAKMDSARKIFRDFMRDRNVIWGDPLKPSSFPTADWLAEREGGDQAIGQLARLYDLTALARPVSNALVPRESLLETILFDSGRPILIAPPESAATIGEVILIAWNGSTESARAITFAEPFLRRAKRVTLLEVEGGTVAGPTVKEVDRAMLRAGVPVEVRQVRADGRSIGESILQEADKLGADLLVKGAYSHSRLRQMIFGGATKHIMNEANIPVLMAH